MKQQPRSTWECQRCGVDCHTREGFLAHARTHHAIGDGPVLTVRQIRDVFYDEDPAEYPVEFRSLPDLRREASTAPGWWIVVLFGAAATAFLIGWGYVVADLARSAFRGWFGS